MRTTMLTFAGLAAGLLAPRFDETTEPPLQLTLHVDGKEHRLVAGEKATLPIGGQPREVMVTIGAERRFAAAGIAFDYPSHMGFEYADDVGLRLWTLDGNDATVMVFELAGQDPAATARDVLAGALSQFDTDAGPEQTKLVLGGAERTAWQAKVAVMGNRMLMTTCAVTVGDRCSVVMLQDVLGDEGKVGAESARVRALLHSSFRAPTK